MKYTIRKLTLSAMFVALSVVGGQLKVFDTVAFDSLPAFVAGLTLGPVYGGIIGFIGHIVNALTSGFPFSLYAHLIVAVCMFFSVFIFSYTYKNIGEFKIYFNIIISTILGMLFNGVIALLLLIPLLGKALCYSLMIPISIVSLINIILAIFIYIILERTNIFDGVKNDI